MLCSAKNFVRKTMCWPNHVLAKYILQILYQSNIVLSNQCGVHKTFYRPNVLSAKSNLGWKISQLNVVSFEYCHPSIVLDKSCVGQILFQSKIMLAKCDFRQIIVSVKCCISQVLCLTNDVAKHFLCQPNVLLAVCCVWYMLWWLNVASARFVKEILCQANIVSAR